MNRFTNEPDKNHEYAFSASLGDEIHISDVKESGRNDYTCLGCGKPMQAILRKIHDAKPYFRHDVQDVPVAERCSFSNEEHRRKIILDALLLDKQIRLPPLYKLPPPGIEGLAIPLQESQIFYFTDIKQKQTIYESTAGDILIAGEDQNMDGDLLLNADAICYNQDSEPILIILFSEGKRKKRASEQMAIFAKLRINTITITPAKASPEEIRSTLNKGKSNKWLYNNEERQVDYLSLSSKIERGISTADSDQGQLYVETFECRKAQINNLLRALNKCLGSESYRIADEHNRRIIGETEFAIGRAEERRDELRILYRASAEAGNHGELAEIERRRGELRVAKSGLTERYRDLEGRYQSKKRELTEQARILESTIHQEERSHGGSGRTIEELRTEIERRFSTEESRITEEFRGAIRSIDRKQRETDEFIANEEISVERLRDSILRAPEDFSAEQERERKRYDYLENAEKQAIQRLEEERDGRSERIERARTELVERFDQLRRQAAIDAETRATSGTSGLSKRYKKLLDARGLWVAIKHSQIELQQLHAAKKFLESAAGKEWLQKRRSK